MYMVNTIVIPVNVVYIPNSDLVAILQGNSGNGKTRQTIELLKKGKEELDVLLVSDDQSTFNVAEEGITIPSIAIPKSNYDLYTFEGKKGIRYSPSPNQLYYNSIPESKEVGLVIHLHPLDSTIQQRSIENYLNADRNHASRFPSVGKRWKNCCGNWMQLLSDFQVPVIDVGLKDQTPEESASLLFEYLTKYER
jgi:hypothetical protein